MATLSFSPANPKALQATTCTASGLSATTAYVLTVSHPGGVQIVKFTSDGSGGFTTSFVAPGPGAYTASVTPASQAASASATLTVGGH